MYCRNCGKELPENSKFCNNCGAQQEVEEQTVHSTNKDEEKINAKKALILNYSKIIFIIAPFISFASLFCTIVTTSNFIRAVAIIILIISAILWCVSCYLTRKMMKQTIGKSPSIKWALNNVWSAFAGLFVVGCFLLSFTTGDSAEPINSPDVSATVATTTEATTEATIEISAKELIKAYQENEINASNKYKDKYLRITGYVDDVGQSDNVFMSDSYYIYIDYGYDYDFNDIRCSLNDESVEKAAELKSGDKITIVGRCEGFSITSIDMYDCIIVE